LLVYPAMSATPRTYSLATAILISASLLAAPGCIIVSDDDSTLTVDNQSDFVIEEINVAQVDDPDWGPNLIPEALFPDETVDISLDCDVYDARLFDEDGVECDLDGIDLCFDDALWVIRNNTCSVWTAARETRRANGIESKADLRAKQKDAASSRP
jgi:hypothetical protein